MFCSNSEDAKSCEAFVRNKLLFKNEAECRGVVPSELKSLLKMHGGHGQWTCLPLPQTGTAT